MSKDFIFRRPKKSDIPFVKSTWLNSFYSSHFSGPLPKHLYYKTYSPWLDSLIAENKTLLAVLPEDEDEIFGYIVYEAAPLPILRRCGSIVNGEPIGLPPKPVVYYVFVKEAYRKHGVCRALLAQARGEVSQPDAGFYFCFRTAVVSKLVPLKFNGEFQPAIARKKGFYDEPANE